MNMYKRIETMIGRLLSLLLAAWTTPKTWSTDELVTAAMLNTHIRDNLNALKAPPTDSYVFDDGADWTTTSATFADIDATDLAVTITTTGGDVLVHFHGNAQHSGAGERINFNFSVDGVDHAADDGVIYMSGTVIVPVSFTRLVTGLSAAAHTFKMRWKTSGATATLLAGAGTANKDVHGQFWAREI
jgi:hypothetical protein